MRLTVDVFIYAHLDLFSDSNQSPVLLEIRRQTHTNKKWGTDVHKILFFMFVLPVLLKAHITVSDFI